MWQGGNDRVLYRSGCCIHDWRAPVFSPDGSKIAFGLGVEDGFYVFVMTAEGARCPSAPRVRRTRVAGAPEMNVRSRRMVSLLVLVLGVGCGGADAPEDTPEPTGQPSSSPSAEVSPLVGEWKRVTKCEELVRLLEANGLGERAAQAIEGNGWVGGTLEQLEKKDDPCEGAVPREHSHFFTEFGTFGSLDWRGEQVDDGTYEIVDDRTFMIGEATFHFEIQGDTISVRTGPARQVHRLRLRVDDRGRLPRLHLGTR